MGFSDETYAAARKYTDDTVAGAGGLAGVPCQIQSITPITGGNRVTFLWIDNNGDEHTSTMNVMNGVDGEDGEDGKGIQSVSVNAENHLIITYTDGTSADAGQIEIHSAVDSVNGQTGAVVLDAEDVGALPDDTPIPSKTSDLTNDSGFITKVVNDLVNYYLKSETYSKAEVDDIVTAIKNSRFEVVATLPTTDIKTNVIYLVPKSPSQTSNVKDEYINLDGTTAGWEKIGDTEIDLSDYVTTQALNTALADYTTTADLTTLLAAKQDTLTFDNVPTENSDNPVKSGGVYAANEALTNQVKDMNNVYGSKNLLIIRQYTRTYNGVSITVNDDGSISFKGTPSAAFNLSANTRQTAEDQLENDWVKPFLGKECIFSSGIDYDVTSANITIAYKMTASDTLHYILSGSRFTFNEIPYLINVSWYLPTTLSFDTTWKPMIRLASITDDTYEPYAKTNQQLTQDTTALLDNTEVNGAVNMLDFTHASEVRKGYTFTNTDGVVTVTGSRASGETGNADHYVNITLTKGTYKVSGCPSGGSNDTWRLLVNINDGAKYAFDYGDGAVFTLTEESSLKVYCTIMANYSDTVNLTFYPMITVPSYNGDYVPYAKSNRELTEDVDSMYSDLLNNGFLGLPGQPKAIDNINNYRMNGFFRTKIDNVDHYGIAMCFNADWVLQIATQTRGTDIKFRIYNNGTWTSWKTISTV